ncbi:hypothetical protein KAR02_06130 [Candidatus Bipolaricaulota bacterium]|nr:hypothetical protein [Candidatus Bipolaricaulota bacterium]
MRIKPLLTLLVLALLVPGLMLSLSGCGGGSSEPSSTSDPVVADTTEPAAEEPIDVVPDAEESASTVEEPVVEETEPSDSVDAEPSTESLAEEPAEQPVLSWARDAGGLNHCDRLSIYADGRVEAVVCKATAVEPTVYGNLTEEQLAQVLAWAAEYSAFTRREMEMSFAVRKTLLHGTGESVPALDVKVEIAALAAEIFLELTEPE